MNCIGVPAFYTFENAIFIHDSIDIHFYQILHSIRNSSCVASLEELVFVKNPKSKKLHSRMQRHDFSFLRMKLEFY